MYPEKPAIKLSPSQNKYLNDSLPPDVRELMESAEEFFILAEVGRRERTESDLTTFQPNRIAYVTDPKQRKKVLESFYADAAETDGGANCWEPHHALRATKDGQTIEIEICFDCAKFRGAGKLELVKGTIVREGRRSEELFDNIVKNQSVELEK